MSFFREPKGELDTASRQYDQINVNTQSSNNDEESVRRGYIRHGS